MLADPIPAKRELAFLTDEPRLFDQATPVGAQVEHDPARPGVQLAVHRFAHFAVRAGAERRQCHHAELDAADRTQR